MSDLQPGKGGGVVAPIAGLVTATTLPVTGAFSTVIDVAAAIAVGLVVWAVVYVTIAKYNKKHAQ